MKPRFSIVLFAVFALGIAVLAACTPASPQAAEQPQAVQIPTNTTQPPAPTEAPIQSPSVTPTEDNTPTIESPTQEAAAPWVSYIGADSNLWIINPTRGELRQVTQDALPLQPGMLAIEYCCGVWSSDGKYMAYSRQVGTPVAEGYQYAFGLWVFDLASGQSREVLSEQQTAGFSWQPGTHTLTYAMTIPGNYFATRGGVDPALAAGIWAIDVDSGTTSELVKPERGFSLVNPRWSPNGQLIGFEEVYLMEGRGKFAFYDFSAKQYIAWDKAIGGYRWSQDGETIFYDYLTYAPSGTERIFRNNRQNTAEKQISPDIANTFAYNPVLSPDGSQVVYMTEEMLGEGRSRYQIVSQPAASGDVTVLGEFEQPGDLSFSPDGSLLMLTTGPWDNRQIQLFSLADRSLRSLVQGRMPEWQPVKNEQQ